MLRQLRCKKVTPEQVCAAHGVLRLEDRYSKGRAVTALAHKFGFNNKCAENLLTLAVANYVITDKLEKLGLNKQIVSVDTRKRKLVDLFGGRGVEYFGALDFRREWGDDFWKRTGWSKSKFYRVRAKLMKAGLWIATSTEHPLPILNDAPRQRPDLTLVYKEGIRQAA
jgi:hypothetical protein